MAEQCPKCSQVMVGPRWDRGRDVLTYHCACGYRKSKPWHDRAQGTDAWQILTRDNLKELWR